MSDAPAAYTSSPTAAAEAYVNGPIVARIKANPDVSELDIRIFDVRERMTAITNGPVPGLALAAE